jgi:hypothetical protein
MRAEEIVGQGFPVGEMQHGQVAGEHFQLRFQRVRRVGVARGDHQQSRMRLCGARDRECKGAGAGGGAPVGALLGAARQRRVQQGRTRRGQRKKGSAQGRGFYRSPMAVAVNAGRDGRDSVLEPIREQARIALQAQECRLAVAAAAGDDVAGTGEQQAAVAQHRDGESFIGLGDEREG